MVEQTPPAEDCRGGSELESSSEGCARAPGLTADHSKLLKSLPAADLRGKAVLVRVELNTPLSENGDGGGGLVVQDDTRARAALPTVAFLAAAGACVTLASHLGRPDGARDPKYSLKPVAACLARLLEPLGVAFVGMADDCVGEEVKRRVAALREGEVLLLENTRFHPGEERGDPAFAAELAAPFDMFVMDAFGAAHRAHASVVGVTQHLCPCVMGFLMEREMRFLQGTMDHMQRPAAAIVGGAKVKDKLGIITNLMTKFDTVVIGGKMAFTFLAAQGVQVGGSHVQQDMLETARAVLANTTCQIILPEDVVLAELDSSKPAQGFAWYSNACIVGTAVLTTSCCSAESPCIPETQFGLDIGPASCKMIARALQGYKTVVWNGPMGVCEHPDFAVGTEAISRTLVELTRQGACTVVAGGDSVAAIQEAGYADQVTHISTGGGAALELLEGKVLPGIESLTKCCA